MIPASPARPDYWNGMPVVLSPWLTIPGPTLTVRRSWRERLWSRPWRPWRATRLQQTELPNPDVFKIDGKLAMHPETFAELRRMTEGMR